MRVFIETEPDKRIVPPFVHLSISGSFNANSKDSRLIIQQGEMSIEVDLEKEDLRPIISRLAQIQRFNHPEEKFGVVV